MKIIVLGAGESGVGSAYLAKTLGMEVFVSSKGEIADKYLQQLISEGINYEQGDHSLDKILSADLVIKSPGIPDKAPIIKSIKEKNIPIISEIEFAGKYTKAKNICITGSNGKTTTTTLAYKILKDAGVKVALGGNIGLSYAYQVAQEVKGLLDVDYYVLELSSFQLDGMYDFKAYIAVLMNITPDHLDRYEYKMQNYIDSKMRITQNQGAGDSFIYCIDDKNIETEVPRHYKGQKHLPFSKLNRGGMGACLHGEKLSACCGTKSLTIEAKDLPIKGLHNAYNAMAASLIALNIDIEPEKIISSLMSFEGVEHRLEKVAVKEGVEYINDSKATNVDSVWYALESMTHPTVWIAGGTDKGNDYSALSELVKQKVKALVCMGVDNSKLKEAFKDHGIVIYDTNSMSDAVSTAKEAASSGDVVLLSPACASFDLFNNYEHRGELFKQEVEKL